MPLVIRVYVTELQFQQMCDSFMVRTDLSSDEKSAVAASGLINMVLIGFDVILNNTKVIFLATRAWNFPHGIEIHNLFVQHEVFGVLALVTLFYDFIRIIRKFQSEDTEESRLWAAYLKATRSHPAFCHYLYYLICGYSTADSGKNYGDDEWRFGSSHASRGPK